VQNAKTFCEQGTEMRLTEYCPSKMWMDMMQASTDVPILWTDMVQAGTDVPILWIDMVQAGTDVPILRIDMVPVLILVL